VTAAHLLATLTIADSAWTTEPRLPRENRESFIRRIVLGETPESATEEAASYSSPTRSAGLVID
jgi:hypothetical protein